MLAFVAFWSTFLPVVPWTAKSAEALMACRVTFALACVLSTVCSFVCARLARSTEDTARETRVTLISYTTVLMVLSIALTSFDYASNHSFFYYMLVLVLIFGILYINPMVTIINNVMYSALLVAILYAKGEADSRTAIVLCAYGMLAMIVSISNYHARTRASEANEMVFELSRHDSLTKTKNRRAVDEDIPEALGHRTYMLLGDIDDFKFYNDSFGHDKGDELLQSLADSMCRAFGHENVYRYGGDEFIAIVVDVEEPEFQSMIAEWRSTFSGVEVEGKRYAPTTSGGYVYGIPQTTEDLQKMLLLADIRLYDAKQAGRNRVLGAAYTDDMAAGAQIDTEHLRDRRSGNLDPLTGLPSMTYFMLHANSLLESPLLEDEQFYVVYFNVENMKAYDERFGMARGDDILVFVAQAIEAAFDQAIVTRVGDDRFALITYNDPFAPIEEVYKTVHEHKGDYGAVMRAGVYEYARGDDLNTACDFAKLACDYIKGRRDVRCYVYDEALHAMRERKQLILNRFEHAIENGHIQAYYQPIVRSVSGRISEFEALARWFDPDDGFIAPGDFIPVLEEFRLVHLLDLHIVECVCKEFKAVSSEGVSPLPVSINLSRYDIEACDIADKTAEIMRCYDVPARMINIEITESAFSNNTDLLRATIDRFHELGMQVWMDDFGSGYSSLGILREFDFDVVKFDMLFLRDRDERSSARSHMMIPHLINMAKELGIQTLVEGVETQEQREFLRGVGCEKLQGFVFERPAPAARALELLGDTKTSVETPDERDYYNPIGQVNLATPVAIDPDIAHSVEMSGGMPAAIVEFRGSHVHYVRWNTSYLDYLRDIGMDTIENSTAQMNDLSRVQAQGFFKAADYLRGKQDWLNLSFYEDQDLCTGMARCVAVDEASGAAAFLYIAFNVTRYLARAGLSVNEETLRR